MLARKSSVSLRLIYGFSSRESWVQSLVGTRLKLRGLSFSKFMSKIKFKIDHELYSAKNIVSEPAKTFQTIRDMYEVPNLHRAHVGTKGQALCDACAGHIGRLMLANRLSTFFALSTGSDIK